MSLIEHTFEIQGEEVDLASLGLEPVSLVSRFGQGATLKLIQRRDHHKAALRPNTTVAYKADGICRFIGQVRSSARRTFDDSVTYTAKDALASASSTSVVIDNIGTNNNQFTVALAVRALLELGELTAGDSIDGLTADSSFGLPFTGSISRGLRDAMAAEPEYRLIVDPTSDSQVVEAVQVYQSGVAKTLQWGGDVDESNPQSDLLGRVVNLSVQESIDGAYTAVLLIQPDYNSGSSTYDKSVLLTPGWASTTETTWFIGAAGVTDPTQFKMNTSEQLEGNHYVFRAFEIPGTVDDFDPSQPWRLMVLTEPDPKLGVYENLWHPIVAEYLSKNIQKEGYDPEEKSYGPGFVSTKRYILASNPCTIRGNVRIPGKAKGPSQAKLVYQATRGGGNTPFGIRVPGSGYEGTAYTRYGIEAVKNITVSSNFLVTEQRAQKALDALKDVRNSGAVEVYGTMPSWAWMGGASVNISGYSEEGTPVLTDYGAIEFTQTGWSVAFSRDVVSIELTDSRAGYVNLVSTS